MNSPFSIAVVVNDVTYNETQNIWLCHLHDSVRCIYERDVQKDNCINNTELLHEQEVNVHLYNRGDIITVGQDRSGNAEIYPSGIRPHKWSMEVKYFDDLEDAVLYSKIIVNIK